MKPPYTITNKIITLISNISEKIGEVNAAFLDKPPTELRKINRVRTIKASLEIEGNTLTENQITAILENKRVAGPLKDIKEVQNAIEVYDKINEFNPSAVSSFLKSHKILMKGLIEKPGKFRTKTVGILKGSKVSHVAPPPENLNYLIKELLKYIEKSDDHILIKSCVVHYEIEFIHPFIDGNGRMGRLWQSLILLNTYPIFEFLPFEALIKQRQDKYYQVLEASDKEGKSTKFIEFILEAINDSLDDLIKIQTKKFTKDERLNYFISSFRKASFSRKEYLSTFKNISSATASRDLKYAVEKKMIIKEGDKRTTTYRLIIV